MNTELQTPIRENGRYVNPQRVVEPPFFKTLVEWAKGGKNTSPDDEVSIHATSPDRFGVPPASGLRLTWLGHSTSLLEIDGLRFLLDPVWSQRSSPFRKLGPKRFHDVPLALEDLPRLDAVLITHDHYDHLDRATVEVLAETGVQFVVPLGLGTCLKEWGVSADRITELDWWDELRIGRHTVTATPARHFSGRSVVMRDRNKTLWSGFAIAGPDHNVYDSGDSGMFDGFREIGERLGPFDLALIEIGAYHKLWADMHLGPEQALVAAQLVKAELLIPVHWGTFNLAMHAWTEPVERLLVAAGQQDDVRLAIPRPGESVEPGQVRELERWWPDLPWQTASEHPIVSSGHFSQVVAGAGSR